MSGNTFGRILRFTSFGESHSTSVGGVLDGVPSGIKLDVSLIEQDMARRRASLSVASTARIEEDKVEFLSGVFEGITLGTPICFIIRNKDVKSEDYQDLKDIFRPSHADYTYFKKYGIRDYRGAGRASARETASRVVAGAIAKQIIPEIKFETKISSVAGQTEEDKIEQLVIQAKQNGDTLGGVISCSIKNVPIGLGEPIFDKLSSGLAKAMFSIPAVKGFQIGSGFSAAFALGSEHNDAFIKDGKTQTNNSGGIQGGISNGEQIFFDVAFKPVSTIFKEQKTINTKGEQITFKPKGRHDICVVFRATAIVEAMAALVLADFFLIKKCFDNFKK